MLTLLENEKNQNVDLIEMELQRIRHRVHLFFDSKQKQSFIKEMTDNIINKGKTVNETMNNNWEFSTKDDFQYLAFAIKTEFQLHRNHLYLFKDPHQNIQFIKDLAEKIIFRLKCFKEITEFVVFDFENK